MGFSVRRLVPWGLTVAFLGACAGPSAEGPLESSGFRVLNGKPLAKGPGIGMTRSTEGAICTASEIAPRCLLTASHCVRPASVNGRYYRGETPDLAKDAHLRIMRTAARVSPWPANDADAPIEARAQDVALLWLSRALCVQDVCQNVATEFHPFQLALPTAQKPNPYEGLDGTSMAIAGYGCNKLEHNWKSAKDCVGFGTRRTAELRIDHFYDFGKEGSFLSFDLTNGMLDLPGDSGGPAYDARTRVQYGVASSVSLSKPIGGSTGKYAGFMGGNDEWIKTTMAKQCVPRIGVRVAPVLNGQVTSNWVALDDETDSHIDCSIPTNQCFLPPQPAAIELTASPVPGYSFSYWRSTETCGCAEKTQTHPKCTLDPATFANLKQPASEIAVCVPVYVASEATPTPTASATGTTTAESTPIPTAPPAATPTPEPEQSPEPTAPPERTDAPEPTPTATVEPTRTGP